MTSGAGHLQRAILECDKNTRPDQQNDKYKDNDIDKDKDILKTASKSNPGNL